MIQLEVLVEEPSAEEAMRHLLPGLVRGRARSKIINLGSKHQLLTRLGPRLRAYQQRICDGEELRILVTVDRDNDECEELKARLEYAAANAGLASKANPDPAGRFRLVTRIVIEELESWFIGDPTALRAAFTSLPPIRPDKGIFRNPDNGGTWEALHRFLKAHGLYKGSYPKIDAAKRIAPHLAPSRNRSRSFHAFVEGVESMLPPD